MRAVVVRCRRLQSAKVRKEIDPEQRRQAVERLGVILSAPRTGGAPEPVELTQEERRARLAQMAQEVVDEATRGQQADVRA